MLTARSDEVDKLVGLGVGADDYLTKLFSPRELVARVRVMLPRRPRTNPTGSGQPPDEPPRTFGPLRVDVTAREIHLDGAPVEVTRTEFHLLAAMSARPRMAFSRRALIDGVWGESWVGDEHLVDVHIGHLRRKPGDGPGGPRSSAPSAAWATGWVKLMARSRPGLAGRSGLAGRLFAAILP